MAKAFKSTVGSFLGLRESGSGMGSLKKGESPAMKNLRVTSDHSLVRRSGWRRVCRGSGEGRGMFIGNVGGRISTVWVSGDKVLLLDGEEALEIGTLESKSGRVCLFSFRSKLYFLDGVRIKVWDGAVFSDIKPYIPTVAISCDWQGAGTPFEEINLLTGQRKQSFTPDGEHSTYRLAEQGIDSVDEIVKSGVSISKKKYTVNTEAGTVTFENIPAEAAPNSLVITYTKTADGHADSVHRMRCATSYGGDNDTRVFLWGDAQQPSCVRYSEYFDGEAGMEYFPELNYNSIGTGEIITDVIRHYDRLMLFTRDGAYQCVGEKKTDADGKEYTLYPITTVSTQVGCAVQGFAVLMDNAPVTLAESGIYRWRSSSIRDERNAEEFGERIRNGLDKMGTDGVISFDNSPMRELFIAKGNSIYVYNYGIDAFYYYEGINGVCFALDPDGNLWFTDPDGSLCLVCDTDLDGDAPIDFIWESGYETFLELDTQNVHRLEFDVFPQCETAFEAVWVTQHSTGRGERMEVEHSAIDLSRLAFDKLCFNTAVTPVKLHKRIKTKRAQGFKLILKSCKESKDLHLLGISVIGKTNDAK